MWMLFDSLLFLFNTFILFNLSLILLVSLFLILKLHLLFRYQLILFTYLSKLIFITIPNLFLFIFIWVYFIIVRLQTWFLSWFLLTMNIIQQILKKNGNSIRVILFSNKKLQWSQKLRQVSNQTNNLIIDNLILMTFLYHFLDSRQFFLLFQKVFYQNLVLIMTNFLNLILWKGEIYQNIECISIKIKVFILKIVS